MGRIALPNPITQHDAGQYSCLLTDVTQFAISVKLSSDVELVAVGKDAVAEFT